MRRRTFLSVLGVASCGGIGIFLDACADDDAEPARLRDGGGPEPTGTATSTPPVKSNAPTDGDEFVPGSPPDAGSPVVNASLPNAAWEARAKQLEPELAAVYGAYPTVGLQTFGEQTGMLFVNHTLTALAIGGPR